MEDPQVINANVWFTIKPQGRFSGHRALMIHLGMLSVPSITPDEFILKIKAEKCRLAILTGEPLADKQVNRVIGILKFWGFYIACETNGVYPPPSSGIDFITCQPAGPTYPVNRELWPKVNEFDYWIDESFDFSILNRHDLKDGRKYCLTPSETSKDKAFDYIKENPKWKINPLVLI